MSIKKKQASQLSSATLAHINTLLDEALEETFPASDPISICLGHETPQDAARATPAENLNGVEEQLR